MTDPGDLNNLFGFYACMLKSDHWAYEKEWRIILPTGDTHARAFIGMPKPTAIVLGMAVKPKHQAWMKRFCHQRSLPLKQMKQNLNEFRLEIFE
jgi:hypothetical protein